MVLILQQLLLMLSLMLRAHNIDVVLIDTAGRLHSNKDLVRDGKIVRVSKPDLKLFVSESITGNDCTEQCKEFNSAINIDGIILSKADIDEERWNNGFCLLYH